MFLNHSNSILNRRLCCFSRKGFTLIELLVVIAIIGLLSSVILASLSDARAKARDVRRKADLNQIALALELYYDDNEKYPVDSGWESFIQGGCSGTVFNAIKNYMPAVPDDPLVPKYHYYYKADVLGFQLSSHLENINDSDYTTTKFTGCGGEFYAHYIVKR